MSAPDTAAAEAVALISDAVALLARALALVMPDEMAGERAGEDEVAA